MQIYKGFLNYTNNVLQLSNNVMNDVDRISKIYQHLWDIGEVHSKREFATKLEMNYTTLCSAMGGKRGLLNQNVFSKIALFFGDIFNKKWVLSGEGEMLAPKNLSATDTGIKFNALQQDIILENTSLKAELQALRRENQWLRSIIESKLNMQQNGNA